MLHPKIDPRVWSDEDFGRLGPEEKLAFFWALTNGDMNNIGYLKVSKRQFEFDTGCPLKALEGALKGLARSFVFEEENGGLAILAVNFVRYQFGEQGISEKNKIFKHLLGLARGLRGAMREALLERYEDLRRGIQAPSSPFELGSPLQAPYKPLEGARAEQSRAEQSYQGKGCGEGENGEAPYKPLEGASGTLDVEPNGLRYDLAAGVLALLNKKTGAAFLATQPALCEIASRLLDVENDVAGVGRMVERQVALWGREPKMANFLRPQTLFGEKFYEYYGQRDLPVAADRVERRAELRGLIEKSRANRESVYHSQEATEGEKASLKGWRKELAALER